jgi:hypothetical protein
MIATEVDKDVHEQQSALQAEHRTLKGEFNELKGEINDLKENHTTEINDLKGEINDLKGEINDLKGNLASFQHRPLIAEFVSYVFDEIVTHSEIVKLSGVKVRTFRQLMDHLKSTNITPEDRKSVLAQLLANTASLLKVGEDVATDYIQALQKLKEMRNLEQHPDLCKNEVRTAIQASFDSDSIEYKSLADFLQALPLPDDRFFLNLLVK